MKRALLTLMVTCGLMATAHSQLPDYPQGYFRNPLGIPILLAGNFGECRPGHFHSGMDIKTGGHENEPVYAAADGYISRIKMEAGGFGHGLYITHPNGYTTLYAHLNNFVPAVQQYVRRQQYAQQSWAVDLKFGPAQFPVKKGQQIAFSGNTGGSTASHLHFEIRNTATEHPLNPQLFGFQVPDTRAPLPIKLALYNDPFEYQYELSPELYKLAARQGVFHPERDTLYSWYTTAGLGIIANDFMNGSDNTLAFLTAKWYEDDRPLGTIRLDDIGYDETRYINAYADYAVQYRTGQWIQRLYRQPGNALTRIYTGLDRGRLGVVSMAPGTFHRIRIELTDVAGNKSVIAFVLAQSGERTQNGRLPAAEPGRRSVFNGPRWSFTLGEDQVYADVQGAVTALDNGGVKIFWPGVPIHHSFDLQLKYPGVVPFAERDNVVMMYSDEKTISGRAATIVEKGFYKASVRACGSYWLTIDTTAPLITGTLKGRLTAKRISFNADDASTSVKTFRGELDGKWILFEQHGTNWFYDVDEHCDAGPHTLVIKATDENGNLAVRSYSFIR